MVSIRNCWRKRQPSGSGGGANGQSRLNDPSLDRKEREVQIRRLQALLVDHQMKESAKAGKLADKTATREQASRLTGNKGVAAVSQVIARRREFAAVIRGQ